jgi:hypothetical protein
LEYFAEFNKIDQSIFVGIRQVEQSLPHQSGHVPKKTQEGHAVYPFESGTTPLLGGF